MRSLIVLLALATGAVAQESGTVAAKVEVRALVDNVFQAIRNGDPEMGKKYFTRDFEFYSPGGTTIPPGGDATGRRWVPLKRRANFVRHVQMLHADVALVVGIWKDPAAAPPVNAGTFDYTVVLVDGAWRISAIREAYLPALPAMPAAAPGEWQSLFDGKTSQGWVSLTGYREITTGWRIEEGCLVTDPSGERAAIRTEQWFESFELTFEWMVSAKGNSGVKYRIFGLDVFVDGVPKDASGYEYQVADDDGDPGARIDPRQKSGALYAVTPVGKSAAKPVGEWNSSRILLSPDHVEHWLNGIETARYAIDTPFASPIVLQHPNTVVRFRNLKIRPR